MNFSEKLKMLREKHGYTQQRLADALHVTKNSISHYERNISMPDLDILCAIADIFDVSLQSNFSFILPQNDGIVKYISQYILSNLQRYGL